MATTAYSAYCNQFIRDLDKRSAQLFFYMLAQVIVVHNSHILYSLMEMFKSNASLHLCTCWTP